MGKSAPPSDSERHLLRANTLLLFLNVSLLVLLAFVPESMRDGLNKLLLTGLFLTSLYVMGTHTPRLIAIVGLLVALQWLAKVIDWEYLAAVIGVLNSLYIIYLVVRMAMQFASARRVTANTLLIAVNGYLLIGLICALYAILITEWVPNSFYVPGEGVFLTVSTSFNTFAYYVFINMSTVGFGDIIPVTDAGRALAVLLAVIGPLYMTTVIALLVGKYAGASQGGKSGS